MTLDLGPIKERAERLTHDTKSWYADENAGIIWAGPNTINDGRICDMRGWGHLTGAGALNLDGDKAAAIQDARKAFIAHARADIPALVAEVEALRAQVAEVVAICPRDENGYLEWNMEASLLLDEWLARRAPKIGGWE